MRKSGIGIGMAMLMLFGVSALSAGATTLIGSATSRPETNSSLVKKVGCWLPGLPGQCEIGQQMACDRHGKRCRCTPCPGWYPWRPYKPAQ